MSIHLLLATAAAVAVQSPDPLAPLATQPAPAAPQVVVPANPAPQPAPAPSTVPNYAPQFEVLPGEPVTVVQPPVAAVPQQPVATVRIPRSWAEVFSSIRGLRWAEAQAGIAVLPPSVVTPVAKAELYTAKGSPPVSLGQIQALLAEAPDLPQADQLARMAVARGATIAPNYARRRQTIWLGNSPSRSKARALALERLGELPSQIV